MNGRISINYIGYISLEILMFYNMKQIYQSKRLLLNSVPYNFTTANAIILKYTRISGVMGSVLVLSAVDRVFKSWSAQTKDYEIGICCFSDKYTVSRRTSNERLVRNQDT